MKKGFIFDMDGVIINSETIWKKYEEKFLSDLLGKPIYQKVKGDLLGSTTQTIYNLAHQYGFSMEKDLFLQKYDEQAMVVYAEAKLTNQIDNLIQTLKQLQYTIGLVTASRTLWIERVLPKLKQPDCFEYILSLAEQKTLRPKPYPDGYLAAMQKLQITPESTIILEDSNKGIAAARASGAFTICLRENLPTNYTSKGADLYTENIKDVINFITNKSNKL